MVVQQCFQVKTKVNHRVKKLLFGLLHALLIGFSVTQTASAASPTQSLLDTVATLEMRGNPLDTFASVDTSVVAATGSFTNTVQVGSSTFDPDPTNGVATQTTTANATADLQISKTDGITSALQGGVITYTIMVANGGPSGITAATLMDGLPAGISNAVWSCQAAVGSRCGVVTGTNDISTTVDLRVNGLVTFTVVANVASTATGTLTNTAMITVPVNTTDPNPNNNQATDTDGVLTPNPTVTLSATHAVTEGQSGLITATLDVASTQDVTVTVVYTHVTADGSDYVISTITIVIPAGQTSATVPFNTTNDAFDESDEEFLVAIGSVTNANDGSTPQTVTILDNDTPTVTLSATPAVTEGQSGLITATLDVTSTQVVTVTLIYAHVTADGSDYVTSTITIIIPAGQLNASVPFSTTNDATDEPDENFMVAISSVQNGNDGSTPQTVVILDNDTTPSVPTVTLSATQAVTEGQSGLITAALDLTSTQDVTVTLVYTHVTADGSDYVTTTITIVIPAGQTSATVPFNTTNDAFDESDEEFLVAIGSVTNANDGSTPQTVTILDNDTPTVILSVTPSVIEGISGLITATLDVTSTQNVTITLVYTNATADGSDYATTTITIVIPAGQLSASVPFDTIHDAFDEMDEEFIVAISNVQNANNGSTPQPVLIVDNDTPTVTLSATRVVTEGQNGLITATLDVTSVYPITVTLVYTNVSTDGSDYVTSTITIVIPAGQLSASIPFTATDDTTDEPDEDFVVAIVAVVNATDGSTPQPITIVDNDIPPATPTATATETPTATATETPTATATETPTATATETPTATPTDTPSLTPSPTATPTVTPVNTPTATPTNIPTATTTATPTVTPVDTPTATATATDTPTATATATPTMTSVDTPTATATPTMMPTVTPTVTPTATPIATPTATPTATPGALASIGDLVWLDRDRDGVQDYTETGRPGTNDELGVPGVLVTLYDGVTNQPVRSTTTNTHGRYSFEDLLPGDYYLEFTLPSGYELSATDAPTATEMFDSDVLWQSLRTPVTTLTPGEDDPTWDMGLYLSGNLQPVAIGDWVWYDANQNGVQEGNELGVPGVQVTLYDGSGALIATTRTDAFGRYQFNSLPPGAYYLVFTPPAAYLFSPANSGTDDSLDSDFDPTIGQTSPVTLSAGASDLAWDVGLYLPTEPAAMGSYVWFDTNLNGIQDSGESGVPGVQVMLYSADGALLATATTDADGHYLFMNLPPGEYYLGFVPPASYQITQPDQAIDDLLDSDVSPQTGQTALITLSAGENALSLSLGLMLQDNSLGILAPVAIGDRVWYDADQDGIQDTDEVSVPGVTVKLYNGAGELLAMDATDANGLYLFPNLAPGQYYIEFVLPSGYQISPVGNNLTDGYDSNADPNTGRTPVVVLAPGVVDMTWDAGISQTKPTALDDENEPGMRTNLYLPVIYRSGFKEMLAKLREQSTDKAICRQHLCVSP